MYFNPPPAFHPTDWDDSFGGSDAYCVEADFDPTSWDREKKGSQKAPAFKNPKDGSYWERDRAGTGHGGSYWKRWNNRKDWLKGPLHREGTYDQSGNRLRD